MSCDVYYENIIFTICLINRREKKYYVFIGNVTSEINTILNKLENRKNISSNEVIILKKNFLNNYMDWVNIVKNKNKLKFINNKIHIDDTINDIRKKIFVYLSEPDKKYYILPENQEIWLEKYNKDTKSKKIKSDDINNYEIIGYYYNNKINNDDNKIIFLPHIYENFEFKTDIKLNDYLSFDDKLFNKNTSENNMLIYDLLENSDYNKKIIYVSDAKNEEEYLINKNIKITNDVINKYFKKYWPYVNLSYDLNIIKANYTILLNYLENENYIFNLINNTDVDKEIFGSCNILTVKFNINSNDNDEYNNYNNLNNLNNKYIDLFPIFDYIRTECIDENIPFMKYSEDILEAPFSIISKKALDKGDIKKSEIKSWLGLNDDYRELNGIILKNYIKDFGDGPKYSHISINRHGKLTLNVSFKSDNNATFNDVEKSVLNCKKIIENINKHRVVKKVGEQEKIEVPFMEFKDNKVILKKNTKLIFLNIIIPYNLKGDISIDFQKLESFSKKFPFFIVGDSVDKKNKNELLKGQKIQTSIKLKYKRISGFANMNQIMLDIDRLKQKYDKDISIIIKTLEKKYQKSIDEIKSYLLEWERKYSISKSSKIKSEFRTGILVTISQNNIVINGITKIYQIPLVYKFFVTFINLFLKYDSYIKNKNFKKVFMNKDYTKDVLYNQDYEIDNTKTLDLNIDYNGEVDFDDDFLVDNQYSEYNIENNYEESTTKYITNNGEIDRIDIKGLASDNEIDPNIRLTCNDKIPRLDTCEDFCNDSSYFLRRLQRYDNTLSKSINDKNAKKKFTYARACQSERQPVILGYNPENDSRIKKSSYKETIKYSSNPNNPRWYICPKIWCPYCEIPIDEKDINPKTIKVRVTKNSGGTCKTAICPYGEHQVFLREYQNEIFEYPGFQKKKHPNGFCIPCCYKMSQQIQKSSYYKTFKKCIGDDVENIDLKDSIIYILGKGIPIETNRYGKLQGDIGRILNTNLETGYLGHKSGYLRRGIKQYPNNSFLSAICDILSCDTNNKINLDKIKNILIEKLNIDLFRSLHSGNLSNIFYNPLDKYTPFENYKNYLLNPNIIIDHLYLWDFLQRDGILFDNGINIFIFEDNNLLCPKGENIKYFYSKNKKNIILIKHKEYYEPVYYLVGDGKGAKINCIFDYNSEEIMKIYDISMKGCQNKSDIQWKNVLQDNIKKYDIKIDNIVIDDGFDLQTALNEILIAIKNKKLNSNFIPVIQYVDSYNKVFGIKLQNGLYIPVAPSKLIEKLNYKIITDMNDIYIGNFKDTIIYTNKIIKNCKLNCKITHKILDNKNKKNIIALVNSNNRFIPIKSIPDTDKKLKISVFNYFSDVDESIENKIIKPDKRFETINKKNFEDETFIRMKFELSKYLNMKENKIELKNIVDIINSDGKNIKYKDILLNKILLNIFSKLASTEYVNIDYNDYIKPNKRVPCFLRYVNKKKSKSFLSKDTVDDIKLSCDDDPHCVISGNSCKLYVNKHNLLKFSDSSSKNKKSYNNYNFYIAKIVDELLRFQFKRNEILNDDIPVIINKDLIEELPNKYILIHTMNYMDINNIVEKLFLDTKGIFLDDRKLYEESTTKKYAFKTDKYLKINSSELLNDIIIEDLSIFWSKLMGNKYNVIINDKNNKLFDVMMMILNKPQLKQKHNKEINLNSIKNMIVQFLKIVVSKNKSVDDMNKKSIINIYKEDGSNIFKYITNFDDLIDEIMSESYKGSDSDLYSLSKIFDLNVIILDKRIKKDSFGYKLYKSLNYINNNFIILYRSISNEISIFNIIQLKGKIIFKINELPNRLIEYINEHNNFSNNKINNTDIIDKNLKI